MGNEQSKRGKGEDSRVYDPSLILKMMQSSAQNYGLDWAERGLSTLIEKSIKEVAARSSDVGHGDSCLDMLYWELPALIRSRDALRDFQQLQAAASDLGLYELRLALRALQQKPSELLQQGHQSAKEYFTPPKQRNLGEIWLEGVAPPVYDDRDAIEQRTLSAAIYSAGEKLKKQITPSPHRSATSQQMIYLLSDPRLLRSNSGEISPINYERFSMLGDLYLPYDPETFPQTVRYVGRTSNLRRRMKLHLANANDSGTAAKRAWIAELLNEQLFPVVTIAERNKETTRLAEEREYRWILESLRLGAPLTNAEASYRHLVQACQTITVESFLSEPFDLDAPSSVLWQILEAYGRDLRDRREQKRKKKVS
jgi:hypothetical protein